MREMNGRKNYKGGRNRVSSEYEDESRQPKCSDRERRTGVALNII